MDRLANLRYWETIVAYIIVGLVILFQLFMLVILYYSQHDTPLQKIKKKLKQKKEAQDVDGMKWRFWKAKPTDDQREAVKWDEN